MVGTETGEGRSSAGADPAEQFVERLRNIGIVAHINAGKTTLSERILYDTGKQRYLGEVDAGTATMDWMREEQERGISIAAAVTSVSWRGFSIDIVDTPGHVDFTAEVERCIRVLDGVIVLLDGVRGVESQTEAVWRSVERWRVPRLAFVNKLDRDAAGFRASVDSLVRRLHCRPVPLVAPLREHGAVVGLLDIVTGQVSAWRDADVHVDPTWAAELRNSVVEACADYDDTIMSDYVEGRAVEPERIYRALRRGTLLCALVPVLGGSALHNRGVEWLLDAICRFLPSPADRAPAAEPGDDRPLTARSLLGLVFKSSDTEDGPAWLVRLFEGRLRAGDSVETSAGQSVRVTGLWRLHAVVREPIDLAVAGQIVAIEADSPLRTGETLRAPGSCAVLEPLDFSRPVLTISLEPTAAADLPELERHARALATEDPTLVVVRNAETGVWQISGMGELHLEVFGSRLNRLMPSPVRFGVPAVARCETIESAAVGRACCQRTVGDREIWATAEVAVEPAAGLGRAQAEFALRDGAVDPELEQEVLDGLGRAFATGLGRLLPAIDLRVAVRDLAWGGPGDMAITLLHEAVALAARRALASGGSVVLEPWMELRIECPRDTLSAVLADLRSRGVEITAVESGVDVAELQGSVALSRVLGYATQLRSMTRGLGAFELAFSRFAPAVSSRVPRQGGPQKDPHRP